MKKRATLVEKAKNILLRDFAEDEIIICDSLSKYFSGFIVTDKFENKDNIERQKMVWNKLEHELDDDEKMKILSFITFTQYEYKQYLENKDA